MKLCTVIAYYKTSITEQLKFLNSHCSIVCGHWSVLCLMAKSKLKYDQIFKFFQIHTVDSSFNEDPKNINFSREALISGEGRPENLGKISNNRDIYCYANREVVDFERACHHLPPDTKILAMPQFSYIPDQILGKKWKKAKIWPFFRLIPSQNIRTYSKSFYMANVFGYRLEIAKISLKNLNSLLSYLEKTWRGSKWPPPISPLRVKICHLAELISFIWRHQKQCYAN